MKLLFDNTPVTTMDDWTVHRLRLRLEKGWSVKLTDAALVSSLKKAYQSRGVQEFQKELLKDEKPIVLHVLWVPYFQET